MNEESKIKDLINWLDNLGYTRVEEDGRRVWIKRINTGTKTITIFENNEIHFHDSVSGLHLLFVNADYAIRTLTAKKTNEITH